MLDCQEVKALKINDGKDNKEALNRGAQSVLTSTSSNTKHFAEMMLSAVNKYYHEWKTMTKKITV